MTNTQNIGWKLWLDDERNPEYWASQIGEDWTAELYLWAPTVESAKYFVRRFGPPSFMVLDHDLGINKAGEPETVRSFLNWLAADYYDSCPWGYFTITDNPVGKQWIVSFMESWRKSLGSIRRADPEKDRGI